MIPSFSVNLTNTTETYFTDPELLGNVPTLMLYMTAWYAVIFGIGVLMLVEKPEESQKEKLDHKKKLREGVKMIWNSEIISQSVPTVSKHFFNPFPKGLLAFLLPGDSEPQGFLLALDDQISPSPS